MIDFALVGVQKAGTTTLADLLDKVDGVSVAKPKEPMFFCSDDYLVHQQESIHTQSRWQDYSWKNQRSGRIEEYMKCYSGCAEGDLLGDASTTYAPSATAAERLHAVNADLKIIFLLRDPIRRAESSYWHAVRIGAARASFEKEVRFGRAGIVAFGFYAEQIARYQRLFGKEHVLVLHHEDLQQEPERVLSRALIHMGKEISEDSLVKIVASAERKNTSFYPRFTQLHLFLFWCARLLGKEMNVTSPSFTEREKASESVFGKWYKRLMMQSKPPKKMKPSTRFKLMELYVRENNQLSELVGEDVFARWGWKLREPS